MKRIAIILVVVILLGLLTGCDDQTANQSLMEELIDTRIPGGSEYYDNVFEMFCCLIAGESSIESVAGFGK